MIRHLNVYFILLASSSILLSRWMFSSFNDPEGANFLITTVFEIILFSISLVAYFFKTNLSEIQKFFISLFIQTTVVVILSFSLR